MLCSALRDFELEDAGDYIANTIFLNNINKDIKKVYLDYSANIVSDNGSNEIVTIEIYKESLGSNRRELLGTPYKYSSVGNLKEAFTIFICDNEICNDCYNYIVIYNINNDVTKGRLKFINSNIRLMCDI